jgi:hypothetical protein
MSPDGEHRRKIPTKDRQLTENTEVSFAPVVSHEEVPVGVDVCMGETDS